MKMYKKLILITLLMSPILVFGMNGIKDAIKFHQLINSEYKTPWYSTNWFESPYTNMRLLNEPRKEYWTVNYVHSEHWYVREIQIGDKTFWTALKRVPN